MTSEKNEKKPGPEPERLNMDEDDWREAVRKALKGKEPPENEASEGQDEEDEPE